MQTPVSGTVISTSMVTFTWSAGINATRYQIGVGTTQSSLESSPWGNISFQDRGTNRSATITGISLNGEPIYVRLWSLVNGTWMYNDYIFQTN